MKKELKEKFVPILVGIIFDPSKRKILIGRRENDPFVSGLTWCFPGREASYKEELEETLEKEIKIQTGLRVKSLGAVYARIFKEKRDFLVIYYLCEIINGEEKAGGSIKELKWVKPEELEKYFTTSFHPTLKEYILNLK